MRFAVVNGIEVTNVIVWDGEQEYEVQEDLVELPLDSPVGPGWTRVEGEWIPPYVEADQ